MTPHLPDQAQINQAVLRADLAQSYDRIKTFEREDRSRQSRRSFLRFCSEDELFHGQQPARHHKLICSALEGVFAGEIHRLMIIVAPGRAKSTYCTVRFPAWWLGNRPSDLGIILSHTDELATDFGRKVRGILKDPNYESIFPSLTLSQDSNAAHRWNTLHGGGLFAAGIGATITGRRANFAVLDDLISGWEEADSPVLLKKRWEVYRADLRTRLLPGAPIILVGTRWTTGDVMGRLLPEEWAGGTGWVDGRDGEQWFVLHLPEMAIDGVKDSLDRKPGEVVWPEFYSQESVEAERKAQGVYNWQSLYQGMPSSEQSAIIKPQWWRRFEGKEPPVCDYILTSYDTAFTESEVEDEASYSASVTFGIWDLWEESNAKMLASVISEARTKETELQRYHAILLDGWHGKVGFPELRDQIIDSAKFWNPDKILIEKKASGPSVMQELRRLRLPIKAMNPEGRTPNGLSFSKTRRAFVASIVWQQGAVWYLDTEQCRKVKNEVSAFPKGSSDDWVDCCTQAMLWFRRIWLLNLPDEKDDDDDNPVRKVG